MTRWTDFIKDYAKKNGKTYKEALSSPEVKIEYRKIYPKQTPEEKEYQKIKDQTVKFERDQAQEELSQISKFQKLKDRAVQYQRDETQKELASLAKSAAQTESIQESQKIYDKYRILVPYLYNLDYQIKLIKKTLEEFKPKGIQEDIYSDMQENIWAKTKSDIATIQKYLKDTRARLESKTQIKLSKFITSDEYKKIQAQDPRKLGIYAKGSIKNSIIDSIKKILIKAKKLYSKSK